MKVGDIVIKEGKPWKIIEYKTGPTKKTTIAKYERIYGLERFLWWWKNRKIK